MNKPVSTKNKIGVKHFCSLTLKRRAFRIRNNAQKTKENDVKTILFSMAYLTPIKLPFFMSTGIGLPSGQCYKH